MSWLEEMYMSGETPNSFYFGAVVQALARAGDVSNASRWLDEALKVQADVGAACFSCVLTACVRAGDVEAAERCGNSCPLHLSGPGQEEGWCSRLRRCDPVQATGS